MRWRRGPRGPLLPWRRRGPVGEPAAAARPAEGAAGVSQATGVSVRRPPSRPREGEPVALPNAFVPLSADPMPRSARFGELVPSAEERPHGGRSRAPPVAPHPLSRGPLPYRAPRSRGGTASGGSFRGTLRWGVGRGVVAGSRPSRGAGSRVPRGDGPGPRVAVCGGTAARGGSRSPPLSRVAAVPGGGKPRGAVGALGRARDSPGEKACGRATESRGERERERE